MGHVKFWFTRTMVVLTVLSLSAAGWGYLWHQQLLMDGMMMSKVWMPPALNQAWSAHDFRMTLLMWSVMTLAMMTPSVLSMLLGFLRIRRNHRHPLLSMGGFLLGYFPVWLIYCVLMTGVEWQLHVYGLLSPMMNSQSVVLSGAVLSLAGLYQLSPWKAACLTHCRLQDDAGGMCHRNPFAVGSHHGVNCMGSCGVLMTVMFAVGMMNLVWMALLTGAVTLEKSWPWSPTWFRFSSGLALSVWGGWLLHASWTSPILSQ